MPGRGGRRGAGEGGAGSSLLATGLAAVEAMIGPVKVSCGKSYEAELHRLRGELLLARDGLAAAGEALDCFEQALALGREKGALAWELRTATSMVRLWEREGDGTPERGTRSGTGGRASLPGEVYARYTEGFAFPDRQDAVVSIGETHH